MKLLLTLALLVGSAFAATRQYNGYQVFRVKANTVESLKTLAELPGDVYDFWTEPRSIVRPVDVMVPPTHIKAFTQLLQEKNIDYNIHIDDVEKVIEKSYEDKAEIDLKDGVSTRAVMNWTAYYSYPVMSAFMYEIARDHPDLATLRTIGLTDQGREMIMVTVSNKNANGPKKGIIVDAGMHAREWIAPAFATWLINELVVNASQYQPYLDGINWHILPSQNPDGYVYSWTTERLWRKNRNPQNGNCIGVDLNRNFGFHWNEEGAADNACAETYHGRTAFSETETQNVRDGILSVANNTQVYLSMHSYSQYWLTPWGYAAEVPDDYADLESLALSAVDKLTAVHGTNYTVGGAAVLLYPASGGSDDWAKGVAGIKYSYTVELRDTGAFGFQLPADQIIPNNEEVWEALKVFADAVLNM